MKRKRTKQLSVGRILAMKPDKLEKLSARELRKLTTFLNSAANKRVKRAAQLGTESEVIRKAVERGRFKTTRISAKTPEAEARPIAMAEFMRVREFLKKETSSTRGVKKVQKKVIRKFKQKARKLGINVEGETITPQQLGKEISDRDLNDLVWTQVDKLSEVRPMTKEDRYRAAGAAYEIISQEIKTKEELFNYLEDWAAKDYIASVENEEDVGDEELEKIFRGFDL